MRELAPTLAEWRKNERRFALATVVRASGSAPRGFGSVMAVREDGLIAGSVSGGCVESAVVESAMRVLSTGRGERLSFGATSEAVLFEVGLSCGGQIEVWVEPFVQPEDWASFLALLGERKPLLRLVSLSPENPGWSYRVGDLVHGALELEALPEELRLEICLPLPPRLILIGAVHIAVALTALAKPLGYEVVVADPRSTFAKGERFPIPPDRLMAAWPSDVFEELGIDQETYVVTLSHDAKIDDPALAIALRSSAPYVGALGSRKTQEARKGYLLENGVSEEQWNKLHGPVGLDLGAHTPEEIALGILAQITQVRRQGPSA